MRLTALLLIITLSVAACGNVVIGPVDHSCPSNPSLGQDSGCAEHNGGR